MLVSIILYGIIGVAAGLLAGLLGVGGGIVVVPSLSWVLLLQGHTTNAAVMHYAIASSIACIVFTTSVSAWSHKNQGNVSWIILYSLLPGLVVGSISGALVAPLISTSWLQLVFAVFALFTAVHLSFSSKKNKGSENWPSYIYSLIIGFGSGFIASLIGLGGGVILVPVFILFNLPMKKAIGTSAVSTLVVSITAFLTYLLLSTEHIKEGQLPWSTGYVYWPAVAIIAIMSMFFARIGVKLSQVMSTIWLKRIFALLLGLISLRMLFLAWTNY